MKKDIISYSLIFAALTLAIACGKKDDGGGGGGAAATPAAATPTSCPAGQLYDGRYGCLPVGACGTGLAMYQSQCIMVQVSNTTNCQPGTVNNGTCTGNFSGNGFNYYNGNFYPTPNSYYGYGSSNYYNNYFPTYGGGYPSYPYGYGGGGWRFYGGARVRF